MTTSDFLFRLSDGAVVFVEYGPVTATGTIVLVRRVEDNTYQQYILNDITSALTYPTVSAEYSQTGKTAAVTNAINFTPPAKAGRYRLGGVVNVTAWTTPASFTVAVTYTDDSGNARTETLQVVRGSTGAAAAAITAIDRWYFELPDFAINNGQVAITVSTTGTFTGSPTYNLAACLEQLATA